MTLGLDPVSLSLYVTIGNLAFKAGRWVYGAARDLLDGDGSVDIQSNLEALNEIIADAKGEDVPESIREIAAILEKYSEQVASNPALFEKLFGNIQFLVDYIKGEADDETKRLDAIAKEMVKEVKARRDAGEPGVFGKAGL